MKDREAVIGRCWLWRAQCDCTEKGSQHLASLWAPPSVPLIPQMHPLLTTPAARNHAPSPQVPHPSQPDLARTNIKSTRTHTPAKSQGCRTDTNDPLTAQVSMQDKIILENCCFQECCAWSQYNPLNLSISLYNHGYKRCVESVLPGGQNRGQAARKVDPAGLPRRSRAQTCALGWAPSRCRPPRRTCPATPGCTCSPDRPCTAATPPCIRM